MKKHEKRVGLWIDYEKAFVVSLTEDGQVTTRIDSEVEGRTRLSGGSRSRTPYGPQEAASEQKWEERRKHQLRRYYRRVIREIDDAESIFIFGPSQAKIELEKEMKKSKELSSKIGKLETADKMTEKQIAAKVREFFAANS